jgi:hypothetical protein
VAKEFFEQVVDALVGFLPPDERDFSWRTSSRNLKVWFGEETREHYEVQLVDEELEIGFHAEYPDEADNEAAIARLVAGQDRWRATLGDDAVVGAFLGRFPDWRRVSEAWPDPDFDDPDLPVQVALRLTDYIDALEPLRRSH